MGKGLNIKVSITDTEPFHKILTVLQLMITDKRIPEEIREKYKEDLFDAFKQGGEANEI